MAIFAVIVSKQIVYAIVRMNRNPERKIIEN